MDCSQREPSDCRQTFDNLTSTLEVRAFRPREPKYPILGEPFHLVHVLIERGFLGHEKAQLFVQTSIGIVTTVILSVIYHRRHLRD